METHCAHAGGRSHAGGAAQDGPHRDGALVSGVLVHSVLVTLMLGGQIGRLHTVGNSQVSFFTSWLYFELLERTDNKIDRSVHGIGL